MIKFLTIFLFIVWATQAEAVTWHVNKSGNDKTNDCNAAQSTTPTSAKQTIRAGIQCAKDNGAPGNTVEIAAGSYDERFEQGFLPSGTAGNPFTITNKASDSVEIKPLTSSGAFTPIVSFEGTGLQYVNLVGTPGFGFKIDGTNQTNGATLIILGGNGHNTIQGIEFANNNGTNSILAQSSNNSIIRNKIHDGSFLIQGGGDYGYPIYVEGNSNLVDGNEMYNFPRYGIHVNHSGEGNTINNVIVRNNVIHNGTYAVDSDAAIVCNTNCTTGHKVYNNLIYNQVDGHGIIVNGTGTQVFNNTIVNSPQRSIHVYGASVSASVRNNIMWNGGTGNQYDVGSGTLWGTNYCNSDCSNVGGGTGTIISATNPFINSAGGDYRLNTGSSAATGGADLSSIGGFSTDLAGASRTVPWSIGAYEAGGVAQVVTITSPTSAATLTTSSNTINVAGTSNLSSGSITWSCDRCTPATGAATGLTSWTIPTLTLKAGVNVLTVTGGISTDVLTVTYAPSFPGNTLAAAWGFDAGSGSTAVDSSGNTNTGSLINAPSWVAGKFGSSLLFNGTNQYVEVLDSNTLDLTQSFTISAWVNPVTIHTDFRAVLSKTLDVYYLYASVAGYCGSGGQIGYFNTNGTSGPGFVVCDPNPLPIGVWTHLATTYDNTTATLRLYKNGVEVPGSPLTASGYIEPSTGVLRIARSEYSSEFFEGALDEIRVYNWAIPRTQAPNTSPGATCGYTGQADRTNMAVVSIVGDMNCSVLHQAPATPIVKFPAAAGAFKFSGNFKIGK